MLAFVLLEFWVGLTKFHMLAYHPDCKILMAESHEPLVDS
jgi:hypothetical protein